MLPKKGEWEKIVSSLGIKNSDHIVIYDNSDVLSASRPIVITLRLSAAAGFLGALTSRFFRRRRRSGLGTPPLVHHHPVPAALNHPPGGAGRRTPIFIIIRVVAGDNKHNGTPTRCTPGCPPRRTAAHCAHWHCARVLDGSTSTILHVLLDDGTK